MLKMYLPNVPPLMGDNVIVPNKVWVDLVNYINTMSDTINTQADTILSMRKELSTATGNVQKLAQALGGLYETEN